MVSGAVIPPSSASDEVLVRGQRRALELITAGQPLEVVLEALCAAIESGIAGTRCSVLLLENGCIRHGAAPSLPAEYCRAIDGCSVGPRAGSCGTAAFLGQTVVVEDVSTDPLWADYAHLPRGHGLAACASVPIKGEPDHQVLGTFAIYHDQPGPFSRRELEVLTSMTDVAAIAIVHHRRGQELRQSQEALWQAQKRESLAVLAGGIAHDFNNLLAAMLGTTNLLQRRQRPEVDPMLRDLETLIERAAALTRQMLAYAGRARVEVSDLDLNAAISEMVHLLAVAIPKKVTFILDLDSDLDCVRADGAQIQQVMLNLITNAAEAIGEAHGQIKVRTSSETLDGDDLERRFVGQGLKAGRYVVLEVADSGSGIRPEVMARMFEPFFTTKFSGRGLGLAALVGILKAHQGGFEILSEVDRGTRFRVYLPVGRPEPLESAPRASNGSSERGATRVCHRILLVDDEQSVRETTRRMLEALGHEVRLACDGTEALAVLEVHAQEITVLMTDLTMPGVDGRETVEIVRQRWPGLALILASGYDETDAVAILQPLVKGRFLKKPFNLDQLEAALESVAPRPDAVPAE
jgi:two-component system, cell cycle sensor histidine kinase and response regulator CckA